MNATHLRILCAEVIEMDTDFNPGIGCNVTQCKYNCVDKQHCSLDKVYISDGTKQAKHCKDTRCDSFACRDTH